MKTRFNFQALAISATLIAIQTASAAPTGALSIGVVPNGGVSITATRIDFFPTLDAGPGGLGDFATGQPTSIFYNNGVINTVLDPTSNPYGQIKDIDAFAGSIANFLRFYAAITLPTPATTGALQTWPVFDLNAVLPGGSAQGALNDCAGVVAIGTSCSPLVTSGALSFVSPFVLTNRGAYTDVSLGVSMTGRDATGSTQYGGGFTAQLISQGGVRLTPDAVQTIINGGGAITNTYSGTFNGSAVVPEPAAFVLIGSGLLLVGFGLRKRQVS